jgi:hypothetical protein
MTLHPCFNHGNIIFTGHVGHSMRVMKIITWNRSFKGMQNGDDGKDNFENDEWETLATVLDKILAWEKKLYDEVKVHFNHSSSVFCFISSMNFMFWLVLLKFYNGSIKS